jgi:response regulator RpfG family c-di-GMP phosphodiesterase
MKPVIVIIDSDKESGEKNVGMFIQNGYSVLFSTSEQEGMKIMHDVHPDAVVLNAEDIEKSGDSIILRELSSNETPLDIPVIVTNMKHAAPLLRVTPDGKREPYRVHIVVPRSHSGKDLIGAVAESINYFPD